MAKYYSVGTETQYDALPLMPLIGTMNGGIRLNTPIQTLNGWSVTFSGLKFAEDIYATARRRLAEATDPRISCYIETNATSISANGPGSTGASVGVDDTSKSTTIFKSHKITVNNVGSAGYLNLQGIHGLVGGSQYSRCLSQSMIIKTDTNTVLWNWLDQVSDYKSTPPNATINGTLAWYKDAGGGNEINNYATPALAVSAITASNPTEPVIIEILDRATDVSGIPSTINGQPVTVQYTYDTKITRFPKCRCTISIGV